ncbi:MAG: 5-deoxynucleotidase [Chloroflexota bacterium]|jgi:5'-deoxynucleotidase YfbR-like HD superfamily hydrolase|nr:5-deoxynucleotidase [Chloroflexota bacterium]
MLDFLRAAGALKTLPRQGWVDRGIPAPESVADHTYRDALMAWLLGREAGLDTDRLVKMMLVHDLPEVEVGDATPYGPIVAAGMDVAEAVPRWRELLTAGELAANQDAKHRAEAEGLDRLTSGLPPPLGDELAVLWHEYVERRSPEARFAAQIDKLEALLQAIEYRDAGQPADVSNFLLTAQQEVEHPVLRRFLTELEAAI